MFQPWHLVIWAWLACIIIGGIAGSHRGRTMAGILWTVLLGPLGLAIILSFRRDAGQ